MLLARHDLIPQQPQKGTGDDGDGRAHPVPPSKDVVARRDDQP